MKGLRGRHVLVTGAASGIGEAVCVRLIEEGAAVALVDRDADRLEALRAKLAGQGGRLAAFRVEVGDEAAVRAAVDGAVASLGALRGVVTSAGIFDPGDMQPLAGVELATFERTLRVNLVGTFLVVKYALPHLVAHGGAIVTVASTAGVRGHGFGSGYTASKGGVVALTRLLAEQYAGQGVRTNCICPGATDTPMTGGVYHQPEMKQRMQRAIPLGRVAEPHEIGDVACFLLSDDAAYVNGQILPVDGGATVR
ncbi:MAG TPA: SDR family NAD(P)-dependent oxidoreductase [Candidatus Eisenbacteria bacterium]|nr:SDR family NAD(P)-dependent oxidoreductase [Candidatus Eisenbacteria bacterium]